MTPTEAIIALGLFASGWCIIAVGARREKRHPQRPPFGRLDDFVAQLAAVLLTAGLLFALLCTVIP